jgi:predicted histone-like DNA-binding protein
MAKMGTLKYRLVQNQNEHQPEAYKKWYIRAVQDRTLTFDDFVQHMADHNSPYSRGVIHGVLIDMLACLQELILDGKSVRLGELGLISLGISSKGVASVKDASVSEQVKGVHLLVRNTKTWSNAELRKLCKIEELEKNAGTSEEEQP